jgi:hypothetical protein
MKNLLLIIVVFIVFIYCVYKWKVLVLNKAIIRSLCLFILSVLLFSLVYTFVYKKNNNSFSYADFLQNQKKQELIQGKSDLKNKIGSLLKEIDIYSKIEEKLLIEQRNLKPQIYSMYVSNIEFNFKDNNLLITIETMLSQTESSYKLGQKFHFKLKNNDKIFEERIYFRPLPDSIYKFEKVDNSVYSKLLDDFLLPITTTEYKTILDGFIQELKVELNNSQNIYDKEVVPVEGFNFGDFLYYSIMNQTTIGSTDIYPNSNLVRILVSLQALVSIFITVFLINNIISKES